MAREQSTDEMMLRSARRMLELARKQRSELELLARTLESMNGDGLGGRSHFYAAIGENNQAGILLGPGGSGATNMTAQAIGQVQIDTDAPFEWTHVLTTQRVVEDYVGDSTPAENLHTTYQAVSGGAGDTTSTYSLDVELGFIDAASGHVLYRARRTHREDGELLSPELFDTTRLYLTASLAGRRHPVAAPGQGPGIAMPLRKAVQLPAGGVVTVVARANRGVANRRVFVTLLGSKVVV